MHLRRIKFYLSQNSWRVSEAHKIIFPFELAEFEVPFLVSTFRIKQITQTTHLQKDYSETSSTRILQEIENESQKIFWEFQIIKIKVKDLFQSNCILKSNNWVISVSTLPTQVTNIWETNFQFSELSMVKKFETEIAWAGKISRHCTKKTGFSLRFPIACISLSSIRRTRFRSSRNAVNSIVGRCNKSYQLKFVIKKSILAEGTKSWAGFRQ